MDTDAGPARPPGRRAAVPTAPWISSVGFSSPVEAVLETQLPPAFCEPITGHAG